MNKEYEFQTLKLDDIKDLESLTIDLSSPTMMSSIDVDDTISITGTPSININDYWNQSSTPNVTIGPGYPNTSASVYTISSTGTGGSGHVLTGGGGNGSWSSLNTQPSGKIALKGEEADVDINGKSLKTWMEKVEERLNILTPNPELEKEWDDLRKLGEKYRKLEKKCKEKAEVWKKLKSMPPPKLD